MWATRKRKYERVSRNIPSPAGGRAGASLTPKPIIDSSVVDVGGNRVAVTEGARCHILLPKLPAGPSVKMALTKDCANGRWIGRDMFSTDHRRLNVH